MDSSVQGRNHVVRELLAKSALNTFTLYQWYDTRPENIKDFLRGIPVVIFCIVFLFFACFL